MRRRAGLAVGFAALVVVTVVAFVAIDAGSHSASDTLRPFLLIAVPVWTVALLGARLVLRAHPRR